MLDPFETVSLHYPVRTILGVPWEFRKRRIQVLAIRDLLTEPLLPSEFLRRPLIHRGRWLVTARELDSGAVKRFYLENFREFYKPTVLRLGLYYPDQSQPPLIISHRFGVSRQQRQTLAAVIKNLESHDWNGPQLRITVERKGWQ